MPRKGFKAPADRLKSRGTSGLYIVSVDRKVGVNQQFIPAVGIFTELLPAYALAREYVAAFYGVHPTKIILKWQKAKKPSNTAYHMNRRANREYIRVWLTTRIMQKAFD